MLEVSRYVRGEVDDPVCDPDPSAHPRDPEQLATCYAFCSTSLVLGFCSYSSFFHDSQHLRGDVDRVDNDLDPCLCLVLSLWLNDALYLQIGPDGHADDRDHDPDPVLGEYDGRWSAVCVNLNDGVESRSEKDGQFCGNGFFFSWSSRPVLGFWRETSNVLVA
jgi:hypothetical protein